MLNEMTNDQLITLPIIPVSRIGHSDDHLLGHLIAYCPSAVSKSTFYPDKIVCCRNLRKRRICLNSTTMTIVTDDGHIVKDAARVLPSFCRRPSVLQIRSFIDTNR